MNFMTELAVKTLILLVSMKRLFKIIVMIDIYI